MPNLPSHTPLLDVTKSRRCHCIALLVPNIRSLLWVTVSLSSPQRLRAQGFFLHVGREQRATVASLPGSIADVFGQLCFGLSVEPIHSFPTQQPSNRKHMFQDFINSVTNDFFFFFNLHLTVGMFTERRERERERERISISPGWCGSVD